MTAPLIETIDATAYTIPTDSVESDGTLEWSETTIVVVTLRSGDLTGIGYTYTDATAARLIRSRLADAVLALTPFQIPLAFTRMNAAVRNIGRAGIAAAAISAVDTALWDLESKVLGVSLVELLGFARERIPLYGSGGFTSYSIDQLQQQLGRWASAGFRAVKMKVGRDARSDAERVAAARDAIGGSVELFVDANGAYSAKQALAMAGAFAASAVTWLEEPVSSDDLDGLRFVRGRAPAGMEIAAGEYGYDSRYFERMLASRSVDVLQADATRCGGITGFLKAASISEAHGISLSSHTAPALHVHLGCALQVMRHVEYFHDHARIEEMLFEGVTLPADGALAPDTTRPGLGLELRRDVAKRHVAE